MALIRDALKKNAFVHKLGKELKRSGGVLADEVRHGNWKRDRQPTIDRYLKSQAAPKLHIGCGPMVMDGWLNADLVPAIDRGVIFLDICETLPLPDASFQFMYSEHVIEHISLESTITHLRDCYRVLRPGGVIRVATPDLGFLIDYFTAPQLSETQLGFLKVMTDEFHPTVPLTAPAIVLNDFVRLWGHLFIYDKKMFRQLLELAGFSDIVDVKVKESRHGELAGLERHGGAISDAYNELQTMVFEGTKASS